MSDYEFYVIMGTIFGVVVTAIVFALFGLFLPEFEQADFQCEQTTPTLIGEYHKDGTFEVLGESQKCTQYVLRLNHTAFDEVFG